MSDSRPQDHADTIRPEDYQNPPAKTSREQSMTIGTYTETQMFTIRVEGVQQERTLLLDRRDPFDETYEVEAEHPAHAVEKLLGEVEWGIIDSYDGFTITVAQSDR